jgi:Peptidase_C39 like family
VTTWNLILALALAGVSARAAVHLVLVTNLAGFSGSADRLVWTSQSLVSPTSFRELVVSWNALPEASFSLEALVQDGTDVSRWWRIARWSPGTNSPGRTSINGQRHASGRMDTDTLILKSEVSGARIRLTFDGPVEGPAAIPLIALSTWSPESSPPKTTSVLPSALRVIEVPRKSQTDYPEGVTKWCSPTSTAMLLAHWGNVLACPELDLDVRTVVAGVYDPGWSGTGNWVFNTAFAGSKPGLRSCAARLGGIGDLHALISAGLPAAVSVSYAQLKGAASVAEGDGHLVVVCGFTPTTVVINDPGVRLERVRREIPVVDFLRAWEASHRTAYLVWPANSALPPSPLGTW